VVLVLHNAVGQEEVPEEPGQEAEDGRNAWVG